MTDMMERMSLALFGSSVDEAGGYRRLGLTDVLNALRDPTPEMLDAMQRVLRDEWITAEPRHNIARMWQAGIDAALGGHGPGKGEGT